MSMKNGTRSDAVRCNKLLYELQIFIIIRIITIVSITIIIIIMYHLSLALSTSSSSSSIITISIISIIIIIPFYLTRLLLLMSLCILQIFIIIITISNPAIWSNRLNNSCFNMSFQIRNMFNVMDSRTYYICGTPMDCLGDHIRVCSWAAVESKASNPAHATRSRFLRQYLDYGRSNRSYIITPGEPHIGD